MGGIIELEGRAMADDVLAGTSEADTREEMDLRFGGGGRAPLGRTGRFVRRSVKYSAVHAFCESCVFLTVGTSDDEKNFRAEER